MKFFETTEFKQLNREWQRKLRKDGFQDIEHESGNLKNCAVLRIPQLYCPHREEYYIRCRQYLEHGEFESATDKEIWHLHSEGFSYAQISQVLRDKYSVRGFQKSNIGRRVSIMESRMDKLRLWLRNELPVQTA